MIITNELIEKLKTSAGGWTKESLALLGVDWPPQKGWKDRIIGKEIDERTRIELERIIKEVALKRSAQQNLFGLAAVAIWNKTTVPLLKLSVIPVTDGGRKVCCQRVLTCMTVEWYQMASYGFGHTRGRIGVAFDRLTILARTTGNQAEMGLEVVPRRGWVDL